MRNGWRIVALTVALACTLAAQAEAQEYCVACTGPDAVYRCIIEGAQPRGGQSLQMLCVTAMAKDGRHATCGVKRGTVFDCDGQQKRVPWASIATPTADDGRQPAAAAPAPAPAPAPQAPPQTVEEMAKRANQKTAEQMKKAGETMKEGAKSMGDAIGSATKKTWDCMVSFFTRCGG